MDINELITSIEVEMEQAEKKRDAAASTIEFTIAQANREGRAFNAEERQSVDDNKKVIEDFKVVRAGIKEKLETAQAAKTSQLELDALNEERTQTKAADTKPSYDRVARVGREERTYNQDKDRRGRQFMTDVARQFLFRDLESEQRLVQHMREERVERAEYLQRATGTGAFTGLVVPQYLTEMYAPKVAALRPFADICNKHDLPAEGMTVNISQITTASSVELQSAENAAVSDTDMDDTLLTENVQTAAGQQTVSRQAIERGTGIEDVTLDDLFRRYATNLDSTLINQATTGLSAVSQSISYTDGTPTADELFPKLHEANANLEANLLGQAVPSHAIMHSRRWYWLQSKLSANHPLFGQPGLNALNVGSNNGSAYNSGVRGVLPNGIQVVVDNNIATNKGVGTDEDEIFVVPSEECHLWEDPSAPVFLRAEQPKAANLGVLLVVYGYFAYSFRRYANGTQKIGGTGLVGTNLFA